MNDTVFLIFLGCNIAFLLINIFSIAIFAFGIFKRFYFLPFWILAASATISLLFTVTNVGAFLGRAGIVSKPTLDLMLFIQPAFLIFGTFGSAMNLVGFFLIVRELTRSPIERPRAEQGAAVNP